MWIGLFAAFVAWAATWAAGEASARALFGRRYRTVGVALRLPLGLATVSCLLEAAGYFLPLRIGGFVVLLPVAFGALLIARRTRALGSATVTAVVVSLLALLLGLVPIAIAGRLTAAAITNNDATYYITVADRLIEIPWAIDARALPAECLRERVLKGWYWRTGTPSLMAAFSALSGLSTTEAIAIVTALLMACVPCTALTIAQALGVRAGGAQRLIGGLSALSAESLFLGYQHLTGQLAAYSLFPLACGATIAALRRGGVRRLALAALLLGAGLAFLADAGAVLLLGVVAGLAGARREPLRAFGRTLSVGFLTVMLAPFTVLRAVVAGTNTVAYRVGGPQPMFPQRGWLRRTLLDDLGTITGVDPWPPWPAPWPPTLQSLAGALGALSAAVLFALALPRLRRDFGQLVFALMGGGAVLLSLVVVQPDYLIGKILLMAAAFAVPLWATGAALTLARPRLRWLVLMAAVAELAALAVLARPARWKVIDRAEHDRLLRELSRVPSGSLIAFDGLGAPADSVLDAHRAYRAALLAGLVPVHPGQDGGFYRPRCQDPRRPEPLPSRAYALQRRTAEMLTRGKELFAWGDFALIEADLTRPDGFVAAWAPTRGWLASEREPDGRVFRWAEAEASGVLRVIQKAPCARLRGELRTAHGSALFSLYQQHDQLFSGPIGSEWTKFIGRSFEASLEREVTVRAVQKSGRPPDAQHAIALRDLSLLPDWRCMTLLDIGTRSERQLPADFHDTLEWEVVPAVGIGCAEIAVSFAAEPGANLGVVIDRGPVSWNYSSTAIASATSLPVSVGKKSLTLRLLRRGPSAGAVWRVLDVALRPRSSCP